MATHSMLLNPGTSPVRRTSGFGFLLAAIVCAVYALAPIRAVAQELPLSAVHVQPPPPEPSKDPAPAEGAAALKSTRAGEKIRVNVNLVLVPLTVTDPMDRLVTGLEKENFFVYE